MAGSILMSSGAGIPTGCLEQVGAVKEVGWVKDEYRTGRHIDSHAIDISRHHDHHLHLPHAHAPSISSLTFTIITPPLHHDTR